MLHEGDCGCAACQAAKGVQPRLTAEERTLKAEVVKLQTAQGREIDGKLADIEAASGSIDDGAMLLDVEAWADRYAEALSDVLLKILGRGWESGASEVKGDVAYSTKDAEPWDVFNPEILRWAQTYPREFGLKVNASFAKRITRTVAAGLAAGDSLLDLRKRLIGGIFNGANVKYRADTIARTEATRANAAGRKEAWKSSGVVKGSIWKTIPAEEWPCAWCEAMDGKYITLDEAYFPVGGSMDVEGAGRMKFDYETVEHPPLHPRCLIGETPVIAPHKVAGFVAAYNGPVVEITLADARRITMTAQHMLATPRGFVRACDLREGDDVIDCSGFKGIVARDPDDNWQPSSIKQEIEALAESGGCAPVRVPVSPEYLHGDAAFVDSHIDVIWANGQLRDACYAARGELFGKTLLGSPYAETASLSRQGAAALALERFGVALGRPVGRLGIASVFGGSTAGHHELVGLRQATEFDTSSTELVRDDVTGNAEAVGNAFHAIAAEVGTTKISNIKRLDFSGHVYDLQTFSTLYIANGILSSNCRCREKPVLADASEL